MEHGWILFVDTTKISNSTLRFVNTKKVLSERNDSNILELLCVWCNATI